MQKRVRPSAQAADQPRDRETEGKSAARLDKELHDCIAPAEGAGGRRGNRQI